MDFERLVEIAAHINEALDHDPKRVANLRMKVSSPEKYDGDGGIAPFELFIQSMTRYLMISRVMGPELDQERVAVLGQYLTGPAELWFSSEVESHHGAFFRASFVDIVQALYCRFLGNNTPQEATTAFENCRYTRRKGAMGYRSDLESLDRRRVHRASAYELRRAYTHGLPHELFEKVIRQYRVNAEENTLDQIVDAVRSIEKADAEMVAYEQRSRDSRRTGSSSKTTTAPSKGKGRDSRDSKTTGSHRVVYKDRHGNETVLSKEVPKQDSRPSGDRNRSKRTDTRPRVKAGSDACFNCSKSGHYTRDCPEPDRNHAQHDTDDSSVHEESSPDPTPDELEERMASLQERDAPGDSASSSSESSSSSSGPDGSQYSGESVIYSIYSSQDEDQQSTSSKEELRAQREGDSREYFRAITEEDTIESCMPMIDVSEADAERLMQMMAAQVEDADQEQRMAMRRATGPMTRPVIPVTQKQSLSAMVVVNGQPLRAMFDSGSTVTILSGESAHTARVPIYVWDKPVVLQLGCVGSRSKMNFGTRTQVHFGGIHSEEIMDIGTIDRYDMIIGMPFMRKHKIVLDPSNDEVIINGLRVRATLESDNQTTQSSDKLARPPLLDRAGRRVFRDKGSGPAYGESSRMVNDDPKEATTPTAHKGAPGAPFR